MDLGLKLSVRSKIKSKFAALQRELRKRSGFEDKCTSNPDLVEDEQDFDDPQGGSANVPPQS